MTAGSDQYTAVVSSVQYDGEATLAIEDNGLKISSLFFDQFVGYEEIDSVKSGDYTVEIVTAEDRICCSKMGNSGDWFAARLLKSYNKTVTSALMADDGCIFETRGSMAYETVRSNGTIHVFRDCVCLLPPGKEARRVPFAFLCCMKAENYALSMRLTTGESYTLSMLETWDRFLPVLNRAMEATGFDREVILMPEEKLYDGTHPLQQMLVQRTSAIVQLRRQLAGRVIHRSLSGWKDGLKKYLES